LREDLIERHEFHLPRRKRPKPWRDYRNGTAAFVRHYHPDTVKDVTAAFADGSIKPHADGVSRLQDVPWMINEPMLPVVRKFAGDGVGSNVSRKQVLRDAATAKYLIGKGNKFWTELNCDFRGRINALPHFHFGREDHVRALFLFANGEPIGPHVGWLEIAVANAFGEKEEWKTRRQWVEKKRALILRVAEDPIGSVHLWREAKDPFSFVAACMELSAAWRDPNLITRFPVLLDGTCNGIQHLALMTKDEEAGWLVNVAGGDELYDLYEGGLDAVAESLAASEDPEAAWWLERGIKREFVKRPII